MKYNFDCSCFNSCYVYSFHDGNLNFYDPQVTGTYNGNEITGIQSPKVQFHSHNYRIHLNRSRTPISSRSQIYRSHTHVRTQLSGCGHDRQPLMIISLRQNMAENVLGLVLLLIS